MQTLGKTKLHYAAGESFNKQAEDRIFTSAPTAEAFNHHLQKPKQLQSTNSPS